MIAEVESITYIEFLPKMFNLNLIMHMGLPGGLW